MLQANLHTDDDLTNMHSPSYRFECFNFFLTVKGSFSLFKIDYMDVFIPSGSPV